MSSGDPVKVVVIPGRRCCEIAPIEIGDECVDEFDRADADDEFCRAIVNAANLAVSPGQNLAMSVAALWMLTLGTQVEQQHQNTKP